MDTEWNSDIRDLPGSPYIKPHFGDLGQYLHRLVTTCDLQCHDAIDHILTCNKHNIQRNKQDCDALHPCLAWVSRNTVRKIILATTQHAREVYNAPLHKHFKSRLPALNVHRRNEAVATDTIWSDVPAIDNGAKYAQLFVGQQSLVTNVYPMKTNKEFVKALKDHICCCGAMHKLISDCAQAEISKKVTDITHAYYIDQWQSEPYHQH
jgi:hypothetical protein